MSADVTDASLSLLVPGCNSATPLDRMAPIPKVLLSSGDRPFMLEMSPARVGREELLQMSRVTVMEAEACYGHFIYISENFIAQSEII